MNITEYLKILLTENFDVLFINRQSSLIVGHFNFPIHVLGKLNTIYLRIEYIILKMK